MAASQASSSLVRTRSARVPANSSRSLHPSSRSVSISNPTPAVVVTSSTPQATNVSNVSLFLTNLRLLDLDLQPDWPDINALTFTTKDLAQGQKKRIQCVEWALYQLFALWDPEEARNKLQPFFPPLDQVQSLNLRAALLRSLEQAKKNGVLGRDAVVRKTMLDECKGERLEEVLAVLSSAVLKKLVAEQLLNDPSQYPALAQTLALENRGYSGERTQLGVLVLAHKASLSRLLREKNLARAQFADFAELLDLKERGLVRRCEQLKAAEARRCADGIRDVSHDVKVDVWHTVRNNWTGNERWMETLLHGDSHQQKDGLLSTPFDRVWRRVQSGRLSELEDRPGGLSEQLENRVRTQKERLGKWQEFRTRMFGTAASESPKQTQEPPTRQSGVDFGFGPHENLHFGRLSPRKLPRTAASKHTPEYDELVRGLEKELADTNKAPSHHIFGFKKSRDLDLTSSDTYLHVKNREEEAISELSELEDDASSDNAGSRGEAAKPLEPASEPVLRESRTFETGSLHSYRRDSKLARPQRSSTIQAKPSLLTREQTNHSPPGSPGRPVTPPPISTPGRSRSPIKPTLTTASPERPVSPTQQLADQILASVSAASPSPTKKPRHTLSLAERTRLSMASRRGSQALPKADHIPEDNEAEMDLFPLRRPPTVTVENTDSSRPVADADNSDYTHEDLVARTRRSMVGFEAARQKAQLERRRSQRKSRQTAAPGTASRLEGSYFPALDEEEGNSTLVLAEELMSGEQDDYEAVFMSRPKIKTSPVGTPVKGAMDD